eukprot:TRINITY_DN8979_c0_g1_i1.p1 TRINITY_DN8979_c0_g1~~TRINITY_DN8979_c0_g1_i1.p1  ORF type:complete len:438 (+),score=59.63 TRINITY_DN8979_c0_g1_i1:71-1315(+)
MAFHATEGEQGESMMINFMGSCAMNKKMVSVAKSELIEKYGDHLIGDLRWELGKLFFTVDYTEEVKDVIWSLTAMEKVSVIVTKIDKLSADASPEDKLKEFESFGRSYDWNTAFQQYKMVTGITNDNPTFKVFCRRKGVNFDNLTREQIAAALAGGIQENTGWGIDLRDPELHIICPCNDQGITLGIQTAQQSSTRNYIAQTGLKGLNPTVSWFIARCAEPTDHQVVLDICCGKGIILAESFSKWPTNIYIGCDLSDTQVLDAKANFKASKSRVDVVVSNMTSSAFRSSTFDVVFADLPFGRQHGSLQENQTLYPATLLECSRLLVPNGRLVILTDSKNTQLLRSSIDQTASFSLVRRRWLRLGTTDAQVYVLTREPLPTKIDWTDASLSKPFKWEGRSWAETCAKERPGMIAS